MRLKRLELVGFKSFGNRVCLEFGSGITAIVGPNGSGKSNISDAVRWVLGEQSARSLRGSKMEDVIFSGSAGKKPLGMAEVQLTLDNSEGFLPIDFSEVTVTRRVYRSGESQFLINGKQCRLRDIHDLFTDTGLGREGYAIIGQGQIDAVLSVRSQDRRVLLEETAGIIKYRQRKEEALQKVEQTNQDLVRVTDILHELDQRLGPLQVEAEKARRYQDLAEKLLVNEQDYYALELQSLAQERDRLESEQKELIETAEKIGSQLHDLEQTAAEVNQKLNQIETDIEQGQAEQIELADKQNALDNEIALKTERQANNARRIAALNELRMSKIGQSESLAEKRSHLLAELERTLDQCSVTEQAIGMIEERLQEHQTQRVQTRDSLESLKDDFFEFMRSLTDLRNFQRDFAKEEETLTRQLTMRKEALAAGRSQISLLEETVATTKAQRQDQDKAREQSKQLVESLENQRAELLQAAAEERQKVSEAQAQGTKLLARLNTLRELDSDYEGYAASVKRLMQHKPHQNLILGTVADIIQVPQGLELAFEVALGAALQNIITPNEAAAQTLIDWLKRTGAGRATFLPLDVMRESAFPAGVRSLLNQPGVLGTGDELAQYDDKFKPVISSLLGRTVFTEDLDSALKLRRTLKQFSRIVTRDGSVVYPSGAMTGGSQTSRTSGLLSRKGEMSQLQAEIASLAELEKSHQQRFREIEDEAARLSERLEELSVADLQAQLELQRLDQMLEQLHKDIVREQASYRRLEDEVEQLNQAWSTLLAQRETAAAKLQEEEAAEDKRRAAILALEADLTKIEQDIAQLQNEITQSSVKLAEEKAEVQSVRMQLSNIDEQLQEVQAALSQAEQEREELVLAQARLAEEVTLAEEELDFTRKSRQDLAARLEKLRQERILAQQQIGEINGQLKNATSQRAQLDRRLYRIESEVELKSGQESRIHELLLERSLVPNKVRERVVDQPKSKLKGNIDELKEQIRSLGIVNPAAAEEYDQVKERHHFLTIQLDDLNEAKAQLRKVIEEMDEVCRTKLEETFKLVRAEFKKLFVELFKGGQADLILTEPESPLTTGIEIMAQPPGKKLQNLLLLSGGERALTAIALLFAIRRVKPTPFCILDEIDAALDEGNLHRFAKLMGEFAQTSQLLTITHRQATMEAADALYGVTMTEDAVSQIISVNMKQEG